MFAVDEERAVPLPLAAGFSPARGSADAGRAGALKSSEHTAVEANDFRAFTLAVRRGDAEAFARFYDRYSFRLYRFLLGLTRGDEGEAREVCQAAFIKAAKRFPVCDEERTLWAWLASVARNAFIDHYRARRRRSRLVSLEEAPALLAAEERPPALLSEILREALAALPAEERELMQAAYIDARPVGDLAEAAGQTYKAMEGRLARLRHKLKDQLLKELRRENEI